MRRLFLCLVDGGKPEDLEKNPQSKDRNQKQTQLTCDARSGELEPRPQQCNASTHGIVPTLCHPVPFPSLSGQGKIS